MEMKSLLYTEIVKNMDHTVFTRVQLSTEFCLLNVPTGSWKPVRMVTFQIPVNNHGWLCEVAPRSAGPLQRLGKLAAHQTTG